MNRDPRELISGYLDGVLTEEQEAELNAWLKAAPENAAAFAEAARLHDPLYAVVRAAATGTPAGQPPSRGPAPARDRPPRRFRRTVAVAGGLLGLAAGLLIAVWVANPPEASAASELDRLVDRAAAAGDRSYVIRTLDALPPPTEERQPPIDGALLHVRTPDQYVLVRRFPDGRPYATGSDGERSWSVPPDGNRPVRVSRDPMRFRGPLPGNQHGIPFADLRSDLAEVRVAYTLTRLPAEGGLAGLRADKKSAEYRGARRIDLWYEPTSGVVRRMVFAGLPKARGGPDSVAVELVEQRDLGPDYFKHPSHHAADRRVIEED